VLVVNPQAKTGIDRAVEARISPQRVIHAKRNRRVIRDEAEDLETDNFLTSLGARLDAVSERPSLPPSAGDRFMTRTIEERPS
jgi:hypothetical protein